MPTTYAHYTFGQKVLKNLNDEIKNIINENIDLYNTGLHGPDILFYHKPLKPNPISRMGHYLHEQPANIFFENARNVIINSDDFNASCSYIMGFICHFMLDSHCHPYIRLVESDKLTHGEIETEFDRFIMLKHNKKPVSFRPVSHIIPSEYSAGIISSFFEGISSENILRSLKSMKFNLNLLVAPSILKRYIIFSGLKLSGNYKKMRGLIMNYESNVECIELNKNLCDLYKKATVKAIESIHEYYNSLNTKNNVNSYFNRNFG
ncbi:zinc dependent phospholipase C family protein [Sedimentibacter hydroxybenzoicus DSM 7310]|uniref:Zinc dependent phospholipase C family protein n=1 Tax=Sedimentibacter hydroxybenzoicus DSM 7310 TaxID=1123245 RepID=A0A974BIJ9_SEDHY|nr:zinc dependent phospholipase C family protein [Sedimentibacter hydroxybenzoicus]NYB73833.1 zinc dependent phospholipase C family protein [Sedimentibacter hydroxybenzoicus DSM 7310]